MATRQEIERRIAEKLVSDLRKQRFQEGANIDEIIRIIVQALNTANPADQRTFIRALATNQSNAIGEVLGRILGGHLKNIAQNEASKVPDSCINLIGRIL